MQTAFALDKYHRQKAWILCLCTASMICCCLPRPAYKLAFYNPAYLSMHISGCNACFSDYGMLKFMKAAVVFFFCEIRFPCVSRI